MAQAYRESRERASADSSAWASESTQVSDKLQHVVRQGAQQLLAEVLELEVTEFLQRLR